LILLEKWLKVVVHQLTNIMVFHICNIIWFFLIFEKFLMRKLLKIPLFMN